MRSLPINLRLGRLLPGALAAGLGVLAMAQSALPFGRTVPVALPSQIAPPDSGNRFALLIGVMGYPALRPADRLVGPGNDVALVAGFLAESPGMAGADMAILLDDGTHPPATLAAIRGEMARIAEAAGPGDFVYIHFSGHGTQAPAPEGSDEPDGLDELFLPYDVGGWNSGAGTVENALVDDEIGAMLDAIRAKGADVFAVFDACNSGTVTRGPDEVRLRRVAPEVLGVPLARSVLTQAGDETEPEAPFDMSPSDNANVQRGQLTAFFAAQASQSTPEMNLPRGDAARKPYGVFTYTLLSELAARPGQSYADLGAAILTRYATEGLAPGTQPLFEGPLQLAALRAPPTEANGALTRWPVTQSGDVVRVAAGTLHGLRVGDSLDLRDGSNDNALGQLVIDAAQPLSATGHLVQQRLLPTDAIALADPTRISVRIDLAMPGPDALPLPAALDLIDALAEADPALAGRLNFLPQGAVADLRLAVEDGALVVLPGGGVDTEATKVAQGVQPPVPLGRDMGEVARALAPKLLLEARALLLTRAAGALAPTLPDVVVEVYAAPEVDRPGRPLDRTEIPTLAAGTVISINVDNARARPVDIDILYIAADRTIQHIRQLRAAPGYSLPEPLFRVLPEGYGEEMILIVQRDVAPDAPRDPLTFLATDAAVSTLRTLNDDAPQTLARYLGEAGLGTTLRSPDLARPGDAAIALIPVRTRPE